MTLNEFLDKVKGEVSMGGRIATGIKDDRYAEIIENSADEFKENDDRVNMSHFLVIKKSYFNNDLFRNKRIIKLPSCVKSVIQAFRGEMQNITNSGGSMDADFRRLNNIYNNQVGNNSTLLQAIATADYYNFVGGLSLDTVSFDFSEYSNSLFLRGGDVVGDLILEVGVYLAEEDMYNMKDFFNYVVGKCIEEFVTITTFTEQKMLGEYGINVSELSKKATKLIEKVEKKWEDQLGESDFLVDW